MTLKFSFLFHGTGMLYLALQGGSLQTAGGQTFFEGTILVDTDSYQINQNLFHKFH